MKNVFLFLLSFVTLNGFAQQVVTYNFAPQQQIEHVDGFSEIIIENCSHISEEGLPDLPTFGVNILLAPGHEITSINIINIEFYPAIENINIRPASANFPISVGAPANYKPVPKLEVYNANKNYPDGIIGGEFTSFLRGHAVASFLIHPVRYNPVEKKSQSIKSITLEINSQTTQKATDALKFLRNDQTTLDRVQQSTTNKIDESILESYNSLNTRNTPSNYDILVVTKQSFTGSAMNNYILHKNKWGYKVLVKTVEEIYAAYEGIDNAEKVRNCIIDAYENEGISYLMLFGDSHSNSSSSHNIIPYRKLYVYASSDYIEYIPSDMYFACLDGTWYDETDGTWGKPGYNDLSHEIGVGRICADNEGEIENFVTKLIKYQDTPVTADVKRALMVGENLDDAPTWGGDYKDEIKNGGMFNGSLLAGIPSGFTVSTLYEKNGYWTTTALRNHFNSQGVHILNHLGHSDVTYNMKLSNSDVTDINFTNIGTQRSLAIVYSQGCYNGSFDNTTSYGGDAGDCINEKFHKIKGGVVANIGNSRYGWYVRGGTNGASQRFDRYFFHGIFGLNIYNIGEANGYSKDINKSYVQSNGHLRWCCYELTLQGDPSMEIWTDTPTEFDLQYVSLTKNGDTEFFITTGVPYARVAVLQNNILISRAVCDNEGNAFLYLDEPVDLASVLLSISGHNKYRYEQQGIEFTDAPPVRGFSAIVDGITVNLKWQKPEVLKGNMPDSYIIYRDGVSIKKLDSNTLAYQDEDQLSWFTDYEYCVKALYTIYASNPVCLPVKTEAYCDIASNIRSTVNNQTVTLFWDKPDPIAPEKYSIFRDGEFLKETTKLFTVDNVPEDDTEYEYCVLAEYDGCDLESVCLKVAVGNVVGIAEQQAELFQIYPTPAHDYITVKGTEMQHIVIYDITGRIVREIDPNNASQTNVSVSGLENGLYFLRIYTEGNVYTKRFSVTRI